MSTDGVAGLKPEHITPPAGHVETLQTDAMPLFHLLSSSEIQPSYSYNVHEDVCVPNIENMCRSEPVEGL